MMKILRYFFNTRYIVAAVQESALIFMTESWKHALDAKKVVGIVSIDLSGAFDNVCHELLLMKLSVYGMGESSIELMKNYLNERKICVRLHGKSYDQLYTMQKGIPQGSQWGPLIWNVFLNNLLLLISSCDAHIVAYADDITIWIDGETVSNVQDKLSTVLSLAIDWLRQNKLCINQAKTQCMGLGNHSEQLQFHVNGESLPSQDSIKLLGVTIDRSFLYDFHIRKTIRTIAWKLCGINRLRKFVGRKTRWRLIETCILPHFDYASPLLIFASRTSKRKLEAMYERCFELRRWTIVPLYQNFRPP